MTLTRKTIAASTAVAVLIGLSVCWLAGSILSQSTNQAVPAAIYPGEDIRIASADGITLGATYWPGATANAPGVLLLHGNGASRASMAQTAVWLATKGYAILTIDFRGHGQSSPSNHSFGLYESRDARAAFNWLKARQKGGRIGVIGSSLGGAAILIGDDGPIPADAVILEAVYPDIRTAIRNRISTRLGSLIGTTAEPFLSYQSMLRQNVSPDRFSPLAAMPSVKAPVFVIGGGEDKSTPPAETKEMFRAARSPKEIWIIAGMGHGAATGIDSDEYRMRVSSFLEQNLRQGSKL